MIEKEILTQFQKIQRACEDIRNGKLESADVVIDKMRTVVSKEEALRYVCIELNNCGHNDYTVNLVERSKSWFDRIHKMKDTELKDTAVEGLAEIMAAVGKADEGLKIVNDYYLRLFNKTICLNVEICITYAASTCGDVKTCRTFIDKLPDDQQVLLKNIGNGMVDIFYRFLIKISICLIRADYKKDAVLYINYVKNHNYDKEHPLEIIPYYTELKQNDEIEKLLNKSLQELIDYADDDDYDYDDVSDEYQLIIEKACDLGLWKLANRATASITDKKERLRFESEIKKRTQERK